MLIVRCAALLFVIQSCFAASNTVFILCYHSFIGQASKSYTDIPLADFRAQMNEIASAGFRFVSYPDITNGSVSGRTNVLITIDDGYRTLITAYTNVLRPLGVRPVLAIYPGIIGVGSAFLTWGELKALADDGCTIASHGYDHERVNNDLFITLPQVFSNEIFRSKRVLEKRLGVPVELFVYPYGIRSPVTVSHVRAAGYKNAFTIIRGPVKIPLSSNPDNLQIYRYMIIRDKKDWAWIMSFMKGYSYEQQQRKEA
ncbi:MAG: polysaccharide deacetylase family protein [Spirochaetota bacterium]